MTGDVYVEADSTAVLICVRKVEMAFSHAEQPFWHDMCVCAHLLQIALNHATHIG